MAEEILWSLRLRAQNGNPTSDDGIDGAPMTECRTDINKTDLAHIETPNSYRRRCIDDENLQEVGKYDVDEFTEIKTEARRCGSSSEAIQRQTIEKDASSDGGREWPGLFISAKQPFLVDCDDPSLSFAIADIVSLDDDGSLGDWTFLPTNPESGAPNGATFSL
ncbi:hypothetical protein ARMGADRAFT_1086195 [Armillaria gallica]|uniref:Uncharacterized protein n=1 Tax=Armillaria gallica TaxID=47427 RepID=A0A2H3CYX2_ARMGA|nr:hypothetical protein ARMGADRAFT_1086195 [Armillaria gallica]